MKTAYMILLLLPSLASAQGLDSFLLVGSSEPVMMSPFELLSYENEQLREKLKEQAADYESQLASVGDALDTYRESQLSLESRLAKFEAQQKGVGYHGPVGGKRYGVRGSYKSHVAYHLGVQTSQLNGWSTQELAHAHWAVHDHTIPLSVIAANAVLSSGTVDVKRMRRSKEVDEDHVLLTDAEVERICSMPKKPKAPVRTSFNGRRTVTYYRSRCRGCN